MDWKAIQEKLIGLGFDVGPAGADGIPGRNTIAALIAWQKSVGLQGVGVFGPKSQALMFPGEANDTVDPPWMALLQHKMGLHEIKNKVELAKFLKSDGATLGDPTKLPWCGDLVETVLALSLPDEVLPVNPYLARNWSRFGKPELGYGSVGTFWRGSKTGTSGHVGFLVGQRPGFYRVRGGNQSNSISDTWIAKERLLENGARSPITWTAALAPLPLLANDGAPVSTNEA